jgi:hypothetical protein
MVRRKKRRRRRKKKKKKKKKKPSVGRVFEMAGRDHGSWSRGGGCAK